MYLSSDLEPPRNNSMANFYPISTNENSNDFNWEVVTKLFLSELYGLLADKKLNKLNEELDQFYIEFEEKFQEEIQDDQAWEIFNNIYFERNNIAKISPKLKIFELLTDTENYSADKRLVNFLKMLLVNDHIYKSDSNKLNFLEKKIYEAFESKFPSKALKYEGSFSYLPTFSLIFSEDLMFLEKDSKFFLENIQLFLELYIFLYTAQLSIGIGGWKEAEEPNVKECYFILDSEKASRERVLLQKRGYKLVEEGISSIFPILALTEGLQNGHEVKIPLWMLVQKLTDHDVFTLINYYEKFAKKQGLKFENFDQKASSCLIVINELQKLYKKQFEKHQKLERPGTTVTRTIKNIILKPFTQTRGSAGTVFVLTQEYLLLLTNLVIGEKDKLRLYEVIKEFERRGIFFDKESRKALVSFYERLGNVEKMSDSGDAIYVKKTI